MNASMLRLACASLNPERVARLLDRYGAVDRVVTAIGRGDVEVPAEAAATVRREPAELAAQLASVGARLVARGDDRYPDWLAGLPDSPRWLFVRGAAVLRPGVAIVGSRRATRYGAGLARRLGYVVAGAGWPVISGLAVGVDGAAHEGSLDAGQGGVAVLGSGIDVWYPSRHRGLGERILSAGGTVASEFGPGVSPEPWRFPARNRIISGLAGAVIVVEAAERSGALITARLAVDQGREVIAVPGDIDRATSTGCNLLIRDGAHPLARVEEVVEMLEIILGPAPGGEPPRGGDEILGGLVGPVPTPIDELAAGLAMPVSRLLPELSRLEIGGHVVIEGGAVRQA